MATRVVVLGVALLALLALSGAEAGSVRGDRQRALQANDAEADADADAKADAAMETEMEIGVSWDILGKGVKDQLHEEITYGALDFLTGKSKSHKTDLHGAADSFVRDALKSGVRWNDMPTGNKDDYLSPLLFAVDFGAKGKDRANVVYQSHYGCLQHVHAMAPVFTPRRGFANSMRVLFSNTDVLNLMKQQAKWWWERAVVHAHNKNFATASHYLGHIVHMLQDSYAPGHATRGYAQSWNGERVQGDGAHAHNAQDADQLGAQCGMVLHFQGYGAQHGNSEHANTDHDPTDTVKGRSRNDKDVRKRLIHCARGATYSVFEQFHKCVKGLGVAPCAFDAVVASVFDVHFRLARPNDPAGGANAYMTADAIKKEYAKAPDASPYVLVAVEYTDVTGALRSGADDAIYVPKVGPSELLWTANAQYPDALTVSPTNALCEPFTARTGDKTKLNAKKQTFLDFPNPDPTGADHNVALRLARGPVQPKYLI